jgi:hypothetical protein
MIHYSLRSFEKLRRLWLIGGATGLKLRVIQSNVLVALAADAACELDVAWHDGDALCVDGAQVCVLEQADEVCLGGLLDGEDGGGLPSIVVAVGGFEVRGDLAEEALEGALLDEQVAGLLVLAAKIKVLAAKRKS